MNTQVLKGKRVEKGYTQIQLAKLLGMSEKTYIQKEKGRAEFTYEEVIQLASILHVDLNYFSKQEL